jgi:hypothetical protein
MTCADSEQLPPGESPCSGLVEALGHGGEMTREEAEAWLKARNLFPRVTPVAEPGMWQLRKEDEGYMEFVHRRTGEVVVWEVATAASKCTSRPDCLCDFCVRLRAKIAEGRSEKDKENQLAEDFLRSYSRTKAAENSSR